MTTLLVSLVIYFVGSGFKLFRMSWYECMTPFQDHLHLVINKYLWTFHNSFPGIEDISNEEQLGGMSKYIIFSFNCGFAIFGYNLFC